MKLYPVVLLMLLAGCDTIQPAVHKPAILVSREFCEPEYVGQRDMYWTDGIEYLCIMDSTEYDGDGGYMDVRTGIKVFYDAKTWGEHRDFQGFSHFAYFVDKITIVGPATERELMQARVKLMNRSRK